MHIKTTMPARRVAYSPFGTTPPVSLTQYVLPEQDADILLIGCPDARHILFTCFADNSRKIDVTCCNTEPITHARNVLLYTLLIDDESNQNIDLIWNIYYHWKIDKSSLELLESQSDKLLMLSESVDHWHSSVYGSNIRFCDEESLFAVRVYWSGFTSTGLTLSQKFDRKDRLQTAMNETKDLQQTDMKSDDMTGFCSALLTAPKKRAREDVYKATKKWWDCGYMPSNNSSVKKYTHLNAAFLYSPFNRLSIFLRFSPLSGFPLSTAYVSISKQSPFSLDKSESPTERLVNCAKSHFKEWASAFRKAVANGSVLRMFSGDALAFCLTLRNCQITQSTSMNLPCHDQTYRPLILHHGDYGRNKNAPLSFDVIDASHFVEKSGLLNLLALGSSLLKHHVSSCLYAELIMPQHVDTKFLLDLELCGDVPSTCLLFGLCPPEQFTIATLEYSTRQGHMRVCWKRLAGSQTCGAPPYFEIEANQLAKLLIMVFENMFKIDDLPEARFSNWEEESNKTYFQPYNRASFAFILSVIKTNIISDWAECFKIMYSKVIRDNLPQSNRVHFVQDLVFNMYVFGIDDSLFTKVDPAAAEAPMLSSFFAKFKNLPEQLCVTVRVPREHVKVYEERLLHNPFICSLEGMDSDGKRTCHSFSSVQTGFGKWSEQTEENNLCPHIEEARSGIWGTSDMFFSVMVPTSMLASMLRQSNRFVPLVKCGVKDGFCSQTRYFEKLDPVQLYACKKITNKDVFISEFMPRMPGLLKFNIPSNTQHETTSETTHVRLAEEGCRINTLAKRVNMDSEASKTKLADKSSAVKVKFKSPLIAIISIADAFEFKLHFPIPVSTVSPMVRIARTSSYVEVEAEILDPLKVPPNFYSAFYFPFFLTELHGGHVPVPWASARVNPNVMPALSLDGSQGLPGEFTYTWLHRHLSHVYSVREQKEIQIRPGPRRRSYFKQGFFNIFRYCAGGLSDHKKMKPFWISWENDRGHTLIIPSSIRLDLVNNTVILDCAIIPHTKATDNDLLFALLCDEINLHRSYQITNSDTCHRAWKSLMPALVERCRTWEHTPKCEYLKAGEVPLCKALSDDRVSPICSCGIGKFPKGYLQNKREKFSSLKYVLKRYATRAVISPIFPVPFVEKCNRLLIVYQIEFCQNCSSTNRFDADGEATNLLVCPKCKKVKYCSSDCQNAHWNKHKIVCKTE